MTFNQYLVTKKVDSGKRLEAKSFNFAKDLSAAAFDSFHVLSRFFNLFLKFFNIKDDYRPWENLKL